MTTRITFDVPDQFHKTIKTYATLNDQTIKAYITSKLQEGIAKDLQRFESTIPNTTTTKALKESRSDELEEFDNSKHLFKALDKIASDAQD